MAGPDDRIQLPEARIAELEGERRQRRRRLVVPARRLAVGLLALSLLLPGVALASHQFSDVADNHPFHDDISAIAGAGITTGFGDGTYRPSEPVTRQAMAAFLHRTGGRAALAVGGTAMTSNINVDAGSSSSDFVPLRQLAITVPGADNASEPHQLVHLQGRVTLFTSMNTSPKGCPCLFVAHVRDVASDTVSIVQGQTFESTSSSLWGYTFDVEGLFAAPPGPRTYQLEARLHNRAGTTNAATFFVDATTSLSATTFPFGE